MARFQSGYGIQLNDMTEEYEDAPSYIYPASPRPRGSRFSCLRILSAFTFSLVTIVAVVALAAAVVALVFAGISYDDIDDTNDRLSKTRHETECLVCPENGVGQFDDGLVVGTPPSASSSRKRAIDAVKPASHLYGGLALSGNLTADSSVAARHMESARIDAREIFVPGRGADIISVGPRLLALTTGVQRVEVQISEIDSCSCDEVSNMIATEFSILQTEIDALSDIVDNITVYSNTTLLQAEISALSNSTAVQFAEQEVAIASLQDQLNTLSDELGNSTVVFQSEIDSLNATLIGLQTLQNVTAASLQGQINSLSSSITLLQSYLNGNVSSLQAQVTQTNANVASLNSTVTSCCANRVSSLTAGQGIVVSGSTGAVTVSAANITANNTLLGRASAGAGPTQQITLGPTLSISGTTLNAVTPATNNYAAAGITSWVISTTTQPVPLAMLYQTTGGVTFDNAAYTFTASNAGLYVLLWSMARKEVAENFAIRCFIRYVTGGGIQFPFSAAGNGDGQFANFDRPFNGPFGASIIVPLPAGAVTRLECISLYLSGSATFYNAYMMMYRVG